MSGFSRSLLLALAATWAACWDPGTQARGAVLPSPKPSEYGRVILDCLATDDGKLSDCKIMLENPAGGPFGKAALDAADQGLLRAKPSSPGERVLLPIDFPKSREEAQPRRLAAGATASVAETVGPGDTIVTLPYEFRRTGVLKADIKGGMTGRAVLAPAGSIGFYASMAQSPDGYQRGGEVWCFLPPQGVDTGGPLCLLLAPRAAIIMPVADPFDIDQINLIQMDYASPPDIDEKPIAIPGDLRMAFRFVGWTSGHAEVERWTNGRKVATLKLRQDPDGGVRVPTFAGDYRLDPLPDSKRRARVTALPGERQTANAAPP